MQTSVSVSNGKITGTLTKLTSGALVDGWGEGYFLALKFSDFASGITYSNVKVGMVPSVSSGLVTLDADCNGVFKVTNKYTQKFVIIQEKDGARLAEYYKLDELTLS